MNTEYVLTEVNIEGLAIYAEADYNAEHILTVYHSENGANTSIVAENFEGLYFYNDHFIFKFKNAKIGFAVLYDNGMWDWFDTLKECEDFTHLIKGISSQLASHYLSTDNICAVNVMCLLVARYEGNKDAYVDSIEGVRMTHAYEFRYSVSEFLNLIKV